jgi:hypothetical protein
MTPSIVVALAALLPHADKATRLKIVLCVVIIITQENCLKRVLAAVPKPFRRGILSSFLMRKAYQAPRSTPSGINRPSVSPIKAIIDGGHETEFRRMFRLSRNVFEALVQDLSPWIKDGRSRDGRQNVESRAKVGIALFYMAHGGDGISLGAISGLKNNSALKYLHEVSAAITIHIAPKWMGPELLNSPGYMEKLRSRFHLRHGFPIVGLCIDGTHIPYTPNSGEHEQVFKNYKQWISLLCIGFINSLYLFVDIDVGWPGRYQDTTCTKNSNAWTQMHADPETWRERWYCSC